MADATKAYLGPIVTRQEALETGLKRYFTGLPCKRGHVAERAAGGGHCCECTKITNAAGRAKPASKVYQRAWHAKWRSTEAGKEQNRKKVAEWREKNRERARAACLDWWDRNKDKVNRERRAFNASDAGKAVLKSTWQKICAVPKTLSARNAYKFALRQKPENAENARVRSALWRKVPGNMDRQRASQAHRRTAEGRYTAADVARIYKMQGGKCAYCRINLGNGYHLDHIKPLARGGTHWPRNLQCLCRSCNVRKHAKDPIMFAQEQGKLL